VQCGRWVMTFRMNFLLPFEKCELVCSFMTTNILAVPATSYSCGEKSSGSMIQAASPVSFPYIFSICFIKSLFSYFSYDLSIVIYLPVMFLHFPS
jgi:hypothetical protein